MIPNSLTWVSAVSISGVTLTGGDVTAHGGGIFNRENLIVSATTITGNAAVGTGRSGGGIFTHTGGRVSITDSTISGNTARGSGGGTSGPVNTSTLVMASMIMANTAGRDGGGVYGQNVSIVESTISGNSAGGDGGGLRHVGGTSYITDSRMVANSSAVDGGAISKRWGYLTVTRTTIEANSALGISSNGYGRGGGIWSGAGSGTSRLTIIDSTIRNNSAHGQSSNNYDDIGGGGGIWADDHLVVTNTTISGNSSTLHGGGILLQYGLTNLTGSLTITGSTVSGNSARLSGGGIYGHADYSGTRHLVLTAVSSTITENSADDSGGGIVFGRGTAELRNTIVAGNIRGVAIPSDITGTVTLASSLIPVDAGAIIINGDGNLIGTAAAPIDPLLGPLADNGGPTRSHALLPGSPAIDAGDPNAIAGVNGVPLHDQRGAPFIRVFDGDGTGDAQIDMGAFEDQPLPPACDFDGDRLCNLADIDRLVAEIAAGTNRADLDLTGDDLVNLEDRDEWLALAGALNLPSGNPYLLGDADLDGFVDGSDFGIWNSHKFTSVAAYGAGDFNADGFVDGSDFGIWNSHKFTSANVEARKSASRLGVRRSFAALDTMPDTQKLPVLAQYDEARLARQGI